MDTALLASLLRRRRQLAGRERWDRAALEVHQARALRSLRDHAYAKSPFYKRFHQGLMDRPLGMLPVLTKSELMAQWDEVVTDPALRLSEVESWLARMQPGEVYKGRYYVAATSGTTGKKGIFAWDRDDWVGVLGSFTRANDLAGIRAGLTHRMKLAVVSSRTPWHQSAVAAACLQGPIVSTLRLDATQPLAEICAQLDAFQPESLVSYASMGRILAEEQLAGRLHIAPKAAICSSEVLTAEARRRINLAWGSPPYEVYAATETAAIAAECAEHRGLHLFEDLVIAEVVDDQGRAAPLGTYGARVLATVLFARTLPLIRYDITDSLALAPGPCLCGRPFALVRDVQGRQDEILAFGSVQVHPVVFHKLLEGVPAPAWQVLREPDRLLVQVAHPGEGFDPAALSRAVTDALSRMGIAPPPVHVEVVPDVARGATGKAALIRTLKENR